jgi:hypothetical protein
MSQKTDQIIELERTFWSEANNPDFFKKAFAEDGVFVMEPMGFLEKEQVVAQTDNSKPWTDVEMKDVKVREIAPDCVAVAYHGQGRQEGQDKPYCGTICSVYVKRDGEWQMAVSSHQPWDPEGKKKN